MCLLSVVEYRPVYLLKIGQIYRERIVFLLFFLLVVFDSKGIFDMHCDCLPCSAVVNQPQNRERERGEERNVLSPLPKKKKSIIKSVCKTTDTTDRKKEHRRSHIRFLHSFAFSHQIKCRERDRGKKKSRIDR